MSYDWKTLSCDLFKMASQALIKVELAFSCLRQSIVRFLLAEKTCTGLQADNSAVLQVCINHEFQPWTNTQSMSQYIDRPNRSGCQGNDSVGKSLGSSPSPGRTT